MKKKLRFPKDKKKPPKSTPVTVVGIGASAGGLEACRELLGALPGKTGMALVFVQHLAPMYESHLTDLLARVTRMPVSEARQNEVVKADHVYVIPPNADLTLSDGVFDLKPRTEISGQHFSIDSFLRSLAETHKQQAIGVLLSGSASDGTLGLKAIKAAGGITFAQDEASAAFPDMPRNAVAAGVVDFILPPKEIAKQLVQLKRPLELRRAPEREELSPADDADLKRILDWLHRRTNVDFSEYKVTTLQRRIQRRMAIHKLASMASYFKYLEATPGEAEALYQDLLINVTGFFRDPEAYQGLKRVLPEIIKNRSAGEPIRVWVVGCATGEEAYSIAICLLEFLSAQSSTFPLQIFASDLDEPAVVQARAGLYPRSALEDVSAERLQRFFTRAGDKYQISKAVRDKVTFALHNVTSDPPFSKLDLISCRNVLIYMQPGLQKKVTALFHYALKPNGILWLGTSEAIGGLAEFFSVVDKKNKLYARKPLAAGRKDEIGTALATARTLRTSLPRGDALTPVERVGHEADRILLAQHAPPSVVINDNFEILHFRGSTGRYLEPAPGKASLNLLSMARPGLALELRAAIGQARKTGLAVRKEDIPFEANGMPSRIHVEVLPLNLDADLKPGATTQAYFMVLFEEAAPGASDKIAPAAKKAGRGAGHTQSSREKRLERELAAAREDLQSTVERMEAANEELLSTNEEILSGNEELQTLNEEFEASREELQSINEELTTCQGSAHREPF